MQLADVSFQVVEGVQVATISGEVDASNCGEIAARLETAMSDEEPGLVIDLSDTTYLDSSGIDVLFETARHLDRHQQELRVVVPAESFIADVLTTVSWESTGVIDRTVAEAVAALRPSP